jgi:threonylcarbamoyladenosine tRNA methylthiotransferase MtaB
MMEQFKNNDYEIVDFNEFADIYIVNSCSVTNLATRKTRNMLSKTKKINNQCITVLVGCYAEEIKNDKTIEAKFDIILGNEEKKDILKYIDMKKSEINDISIVSKYIQNNVLEKGINIRQSIKIEDGCDNFCSYCIIPYVRGRVRSRDINDIVKEAEILVKNNVLELVIVGIEIASYGKDLDYTVSLIDVIEKVSKVKGLLRVRLRIN